MKLKNLLLPSLCGLLLLSLLIASCGKDEKSTINKASLAAEYNAEAPLEWNKLFLEIERYAAGYRPGPAPRALGYMGFAAYEACITGMPDYNSLEDRYAGLNIPDADQGAEYHWPTVINAVYAYMMPKFFADSSIPLKDKITALADQLDDKYQSEAGQEVYQRSKVYGGNVAEAVWNWSTKDPYGHNAYKDPFGNFETNETYDWQARFDGPGDWQPTNPGPGKPMGPYFGKAFAFALADDEKLAMPPSTYFMEYSEAPNSEYYSQALQVYTKNAELDYNTEWIGEFWSDDLLNVTFSPGPRWLAIANQVIENEKANLETALEAYAKVGLALNDAAVGCWTSKFHYNVERPDSYIKSVIDPNYKPNLYNPITGDEGISPSFPAYPSGHSTMGAAGAEALASVFGYAYAMTDRCHEGRTDFEGKPRSFGSFYEMAEENAWSRVLLGVHWRMDCDEGMRFGTVIGREVNNLPWKK